MLVTAVDVPFTNRSSSNAYIMALPKSPLFSFVFHSFLRYDDLWYARGVMTTVRDFVTTLLV